MTIPVVNGRQRQVRNTLRAKANEDLGALIAIGRLIRCKNRADRAVGVRIPAATNPLPSGECKLSRNATLIAASIGPLT